MYKAIVIANKSGHIFNLNDEVTIRQEYTSLNAVVAVDDKKHIQWLSNTEIERLDNVIQEAQA